MVRRLFRPLALVACLLVAGCQHNPTAGLLVTRSTVEKQLDALRTKQAAAMAALREEQEAVTGRLLAAKDAQMVGAASALYGQQQVFASIHTPTRTDLLFRNLSVEAWTALGNVAPTVDAMRAMNERLARELDETKTALSDLQTSHAAAVAQNQALADTTRQFQEQLATLAAKQREAEAQFRAQLDAKQSELNEVNAQLIAAADDKKARDVARQAQLNRLSWGAGIIAALCIAGAIFSPVFKSELGMTAAAFGGAAVALPLVETWMVLCGVVAVILAAIGWMALKHRRKERATDALALTVQDLRDKGGAIAAEVEKAVADRTSRYRRAKDGTMTTEADPAVEREIQQTLADYDALPAKPAA